MRYLGGKMRQRGEIVKAVLCIDPLFKTYVEPFCGGMWSACAMIKRFPRRHFILNDSNPYLMCFWREAIKGWDPPVVDEKTYNKYKKRRRVDDPMTGYVGFALSFAGKFFGGFARDGSGKRDYAVEVSASTMEKIRLLRDANVELSCIDYKEVNVPCESMVYLDPPYVKRTKQSSVTSFDYEKYLEWAEDTSKVANVVASSFTNERGWPVIHDWGDTVVRHLNSKGADGTREILMRVKTCGGDSGVL